MSTGGQGSFYVECAGSDFSRDQIELFAFCLLGQSQSWLTKGILPERYAGASVSDYPHKRRGGNKSRHIIVVELWNVLWCFSLVKTSLGTIQTGSTNAKGVM